MWVAVISRWLAKADRVRVRAEPGHYLSRILSDAGFNLPGKHVTSFFHLVTWNVMFYIRLGYPSLDVDDLLPVIVWHRRTIYLVYEGRQQADCSSLTNVEPGSCWWSLPVSYSSSSAMLNTGFTPRYGLPTRSLLLTCLQTESKGQKLKKQNKTHQRGCTSSA